TVPASDKPLRQAGCPVDGAWPGRGTGRGRGDRRASLRKRYGDHAGPTFGQEALDLCLQRGNDLIKGHQAYVIPVTVFELGATGLQGTWADGQAEGQANEVGVIELDPGWGMAVFQEHLNTLRPGFSVQALGNLGHLSVALAQCHAVHLVRGDANREANALGIVVFFDNT